MTVVSFRRYTNALLVFQQRKRERRWTLEDAFKLDLNLHKYSYILGHKNLDILFRGAPG